MTSWNRTNTFVLLVVMRRMIISLSVAATTKSGREAVLKQGITSWRSGQKSGSSRQLVWTTGGVARYLSPLALAVGSQSMQGAPGLAALERAWLLVARVPMAVWFNLVGADLVFVLLGIVLTSAALRTSGSKVPEVQARLCAVGFVQTGLKISASCGADDLEGLFEEYDGKGSKRITVQRAASGVHIGSGQG